MLRIQPPMRPGSFSSSALAFLLLLFLLLNCSHFCLSQKFEGALTVVKNPEGGGGGGQEAEVTVENEEEEEVEVEVVQPTEKWKTLKPGQVVPAGSHVRLNLQTGQREVRLGAEQLKYWTTEHGVSEGVRSSFSPKELKRAMKKIKEDLNPLHQDQQNSQYRPLEELKKEMAEMELMVETDVQIVRRLLQQLNSSGSTTEHRLKVLLELEYLVHQVDNAQSLVTMGGLTLVIDGLNSSDSRIQESSAFVLGSALSSNPAVQVKALDGGALQMLLPILATSQPMAVKKKVLFAVASLLRHFPLAQQRFLSGGGLQVLAQLFRDDHACILRMRVVTMLHDMISEKEQASQEGAEPGQEASNQERVRQYSEVPPVDEGWCGLVPQLLESPEHQHREKALQALLVLCPVCLDQFRSDSFLQNVLVTLKIQYEDMIHTQLEEQEYFTEILQLIHTLQVHTH